MNSRHANALPPGHPAEMAVEARSMNRRSFLRIAGAGITILCTVDLSDLLAAERRQRRGYPTDFNAYLRIGEDGRVTLYTGKIEMGQGVYTSLPVMLAEELSVPLSAIDPVLGDTDLCPWDMGTFGSMSTPYFGPALRRAAAEARTVLVELAAERLDLPAGRLATRDGTVFDSENPGTSVTYAELARGQRIERTVEGEAIPTTHDQHTICGQPHLRMDSRQKVTGEALYTADIRVPGMLCAKILRPPAHGATLVEADTTDAEFIEGIQVVRDGDLVAVLHRHPDVAEEALQTVRARWDTPREGVDNSTIFQYLEDNLPDEDVVTEAGDLDTGRADCTEIIDGVYHAQYVAHAPIEPHAAVAHVDGDRVTVWASTQTPFSAKEQVARLLEVPSENVRVISPFVGGGFGGKSANGQVSEAARLSRLVGKPVQVAWTRKEEFFYDTFRPATIVRVSGGLSQDGKVALWDFANLHGGNRSAKPVYDLPHHRVTARGGWGGSGRGYHPLAVGAWRGPGANVNIWAMESHVDALAVAAGMDPLKFRLANLVDERMRTVLMRVAEEFGEDLTPGPSGRGVGLACGIDAGTYVATVAQIQVNEERGEIRVDRMVCAQDMGEVVNPAGARIQMEGCLTMGLGYTLTEEIEFDRGVIHQENFDTYELPRFSWLPKLEVHLVENPDIGPMGGGEPAITTVGAVVANAFFDATGVRMYDLPMNPGRVRRALRSAASS